MGACWSRVDRAATLERFAPVTPACVDLAPSVTADGNEPLSSSVECACGCAGTGPTWFREAFRMGSVVKKRRKRMAKKKHRKLLRKTRVQRRRLGK